MRPRGRHEGADSVFFLISLERPAPSPSPPFTFTVCPSLLKRHSVWLTVTRRGGPPKVASFMYSSSLPGLLPHDLPLLLPLMATDCPSSFHPILLPLPLSSALPLLKLAHKYFLPKQLESDEFIGRSRRPASVCGPCNSALSSKGGSGVSESTVAVAVAPQMGRDGGRRDGRRPRADNNDATAREGRRSKEEGEGGGTPGRENNR